MKVEEDSELPQFRRDLLQNLIKSFAQFHKCQKHFSLELLFDKLPNSFNWIEFGAMSWLTNRNQVVGPPSVHWSHELPLGQVELGRCHLPVDVIGHQ